MVAERHQVARHGERSRTGADAGNALAVFLFRRFRQSRTDVVLVVGGDAFQSANGDRFGLLAVTLLHAPAPAGRFARTIAGAPEDAGEDIGFPVDHVGVAVTPGSDHPDVFGDGGMGGTRPLTIHDLVEIVGYSNVRGLQK